MQAKIIKLVDVSYGGENGFNQAIELASESLQNVKFIQEKKLIGLYWGLLLFIGNDFRKQIVLDVFADLSIAQFFQVVTSTKLVKTLENIVSA